MSDGQRTNRPLAPVFGGILDMIGNTPMVEVTRLDTGPCRLFLKLENFNPGGSIKDRIGKAMIEAAEADGSLKPGGTIVEATAGNTGLGLALVASQKGYRVIVVVPDKMAREKILHLKALGAEVHMTRSDVFKGHPDYYQDVARRLAESITGAWWANQFANPANPRAHETTTGPEIWDQMDQDLDAVVCGVGSGGTITGLSRFFEKADPGVEMILADPEGSVLADYVETGELGTDIGSWLVEGIGEDFLPATCDLSRTRRAFVIPDAESFTTARTVMSEEGLVVGSSSGTLIAAALRYCREQTEAKRVVTFVCDGGAKYLSKMYNDYWMEDQGFLERPPKGDLSDLIARRHEDHATVTVSPDESLSNAYNRMRLYDISQLPVIDEGGTIVGIIDESDILAAVLEDRERFQDPVTEAMNHKLETVPVSSPLKDLMPVFNKDHVAIVMDGDRFLGLITQIDLINYLRRRLA